MTEFVALRPKLYAYRQLDNKEDKRCKGRVKVSIDRNWCLEMKSMKFIQSKLTRLP